MIKNITLQHTPYRRLRDTWIRYAVYTRRDACANSNTLCLVLLRAHWNEWCVSLWAANSHNQFSKPMARRFERERECFDSRKARCVVIKVAWSCPITYFTWLLRFVIWIYCLCSFGAIIVRGMHAGSCADKSWLIILTTCACPPTNCKSK